MVERLGGEDESVTVHREETKKKIKRLEQAVIIADRALRMRDSDA